MADQTAVQIVIALKKYTNLSSEDLTTFLLAFSVNPKTAMKATVIMLEAAYNHGKNTAIANSIAKQAMTDATNVVNAKEG